MGYYINSDFEEKEDFLNREGTLTKELKIPLDGRLALVCLVDNGTFTAAGVCYSQSEIEAFNSPVDRRLKFWYTVPKTKLYDVVAGLKPSTFRG